MRALYAVCTHLNPRSTLACEAQFGMQVDTAVTFATLLRRYRTAAGLSQEALAERAGLSRRGIADLERGARRNPHPETILRLANALGLGEQARGMLAEAVSAAALRDRGNGWNERASAQPAEPSSSGSSTVSGRAHNLPAHLPTLIGREQAVNDVQEQLLAAPAGVLTLTGGGGTGKTRLALAVATALVPQFPDGVWLVELASLADGGLIASAIARAASIQERPGQSIGTTIAEAFNSHAILLVLDNCEHVGDACASAVSELLRACPQLRILTTTRQSLHVSGEVIYRVAPLQVPRLQRRSAAQSSRPLAPIDATGFPSVQLFVERAQAVQPAFALTPENCDSIAQICIRLDGLPLAIELAAAWVRVLSAAQILDRLDNMFELLVGGTRTAHTRQQTLHATLEWSFRQLGADERQLFTRIAVFAGGFDLDALGAVASTGGDLDADLLQVLNALVDKSLVQASHVGDAVRFRLLEPVRQFAHLRLVENGGRDTARTRHALHFLALAEQAAPLLLGPEGTAWFDRLDQEIDNLRTALDYFIASAQPQSAERLAGRLWPFWLHRNHWTEGIQFLKRVLALPGADAPTIWRANSLLGLSYLVEMTGDQAAARALFLDTSRLQRELGDHAGLARSLVRLGAFATYDPDRTVARQVLEEALSLTHTTGQRSTRVSALLGLARLSFIEEDVDAAQALVETALTTARDLGWTFGTAQALRMLGELRSRRGDHAGARVAYEESLRGSRTMQDSLVASGTLSFLGSLAVADGDYARAHGLLAEALAMHREMGDHIGIMWALFAFAGLRAAQGQPETALCLASAGLAIGDRSHLRLSPREKDTLERWLAPARQALTESEAEDARKAGQQLTVDEAITLAIDTHEHRGGV